jgi:hypothetical protein
MKTLKKIQNNEVEYVRAKEEKVASFLSKGYTFCPKSEWKKSIRDVKA